MTKQTTIVVICALSCLPVCFDRRAERVTLKAPITYTLFTLVFVLICRAERVKPFSPADQNKHQCKQCICDWRFKGYSFSPAIKTNTSANSVYGKCPKILNTLLHIFSVLKLAFYAVVS